MYSVPYLDAGCTTSARKIYLRPDGDGHGGDVPEHGAVVPHDHLVADDVPDDLREEGKRVREVPEHFFSFTREQNAHED